MIINVFDQQIDLHISSRQVKRLVKEVLSCEKTKCDEVSIYFVDTETICDLHQRFFDDPSPTDCISFPLDDLREHSDYQVLGEVFVCTATAIEYANKHKGSPGIETALYIVHGLLHLIGYRDIEEKDIAAMREAEARSMQQLQHLFVKSDWIIAKKR